MSELYYEVVMDYDTGKEEILVCDGDKVIDFFYSFKELFEKYPGIVSKEFLEFCEEADADEVADK